MAVETENTVLVTVKGAPDTPQQEPRPRHPKMPALDTKMVLFANQLYIKQVDVVVLQQGEEITLMSGECLSSRDC